MELKGEKESINPSNQLRGCHAKCHCFLTAFPAQLTPSKVNLVPDHF